jgi:ferredoxin
MVFSIMLWFHKSVFRRKGMAKVPYVDKEECTSCNVCVDMVSTVFQMDDDNKAEVYDPNGASESEIQDAIDVCPVSCIHWKG